MHKVKVEWLGKMGFNAISPGGEFRIDADASIGGEDNGLRPKALMLDALAGCTGMDVAMLIPKMKLEVDAFDIHVDGHLTEGHPQVYHKVDVHYIFTGPNLDQAKLQKVVDLSVDKYCGVMKMFTSFSEVNIKITYQNK